MFESLRKAMLIGLGAAAMSRDKLRQAIDDLVARGEVTTEEGRKLYDELAARAEEERSNWSERITKQLRDMLRNLGLAEASQISALEAKIDALEQRLNEIAPCRPGRESSD